MNIIQEEQDTTDNAQKNSSQKEQKYDTSLNRFCPIWAYIDAVKKQPKEYTLTCQKECAFFNTELNTCILKVIKYIF